MKNFIYSKSNDYGMSFKSILFHKFFIRLILCICPFSMNGQNWHKINVPTQKNLNTICFASQSVGFIGGNDSLLLKTIDGGANWFELPYEGVEFYPNGEHIINLKFIDEQRGFMTVGPYSGIYKTENGGLNWTLISDGFMCFNRAIYVLTESQVYFGGSGCFNGEMINLLNNGQLEDVTVNGAGMSSQYQIMDMDFSLYWYYAVSSSGYVFRSVDYGSTWDSVSTAAGQVTLTGVSVVQHDLVYASYVSGGNGFGLLVSKDLGLTWEYDMASATFYYPDFFDVHSTYNGKVYAGGKSGWSDEGLIFTKESEDWWDIFNAEQRITSFDSYDTTVFAVGDSGIVYANKEFATGINYDNFSAVTVYPSPAQEEITINIPADQFKAITVVDNNGKVAEVNRTGNRVYISSLNSGIYFLIVTKTDGSVCRSKFVKV